MGKIQAGVVQDITNLLKSLSSTISDTLDKLIGYGAEIEDVKKDGKGFSLKGKIGNEDATIYWEPSEGKNGYFDVTQKSKSGNQKNLGTMSEADFAKFLKKNIATSANSGRKLQVSLKKVVGSDCVDIRLTAINSNYEVNDAMVDLDRIVSDEAFISNLSEDPTSYEIFDAGDSYDITSIDKVDIFGTPQMMIGEAYTLLSNIKALFWNICGNDWDRGQSLMRECLYYVDSDIDMLMGLCIELGWAAPNPMEVATSFVSDLFLPEGSVSFDIAMQLLYSGVIKYISVLETFYINFSADAQNEVLTRIRTWKRTADQIKRYTEQPTI